MILNIYTTGIESDELVGRILFDEKTNKITTQDIGEQLQERIFEDVDTKDPEAVKEALRNAPDKFGSSYMPMSVI